MSKDYGVYFFLVILAHVLLFIIFFHTYFYKTTLVGKKTFHLIEAYAVQTVEPQKNSLYKELIQPHRVKKKALIKKSLHTVNENIHRQNTYLTTHSQLIQQQSSLAFSSSSTGIPIALLAYLHQLIEQNKIIPENALLIGEHGSVTLSMHIAPNGIFTDIRIVKSSGYARLDAAAIATIQKINPCSHVGVYLRHGAYFSLEIHYNSG